MPHRVMYVELKTGFNHDGPAWIGLVHFSKTGRTLYYRGHSLQSLKGRSGWAANYVDIDSGDEFWVSGVKKPSPLKTCGCMPWHQRRRNSASSARLVRPSLV
jgi:hypothetical protein